MDLDWNLEYSTDLEAWSPVADELLRVETDGVEVRTPLLAEPGAAQTGYFRVRAVLKMP